jgi:tetratricopeptide (TPR) repeat protein
MKSKRQEEPQKKTLSRQIDGWPEFFQQNASRILLGLTLAVLAVLIVRYRVASSQQRLLTARASAVRARQDLEHLKQDVQLSSGPPELLAARRDQLTAQVLAELSEVLNDSTDSDTALRADAYGVRGDLYWTLANSPVFPEATTRPALALKDSPDTLLGEAEADYRHVIEQYPSQLMDWASAEFGLAAIAENRSNWDEAQKRYEEVENRADAPDMLKSTAQIQMGLLSRLRQPILVGPYPATVATSEPATSQPAASIAPATTSSTQSTR